MNRVSEVIHWVFDSRDPDTEATILTSIVILCVFGVLVDLLFDATTWLMFSIPAFLFLSIKTYCVIKLDWKRKPEDQEDEFS